MKNSKYNVGDLIFIRKANLSNYDMKDIIYIGIVLETSRSYTGDSSEYRWCYTINYGADGENYTDTIGESSLCYYDKEAREYMSEENML